MTILILALAAVGASAQEGAPADVPRDHWAFEAVDMLFRQGLLKGYPDGTFKGSRPASRYELAGALASVNVDLQERLRALKEAADQRSAIPQSELLAMQNDLSILRRDVDELKSMRGEVVDLTGRLQSMREEMGRIRGDLGDMREQTDRLRK